MSRFVCLAVGVFVYVQADVVWVSHVQHLQPTATRWAKRDLLNRLQMNPQPGTLFSTASLPLRDTTHYIAAREKRFAALYHRHQDDGCSDTFPVLPVMLHAEQAYHPTSLAMC